MTHNPLLDPNNLWVGLGIEDTCVYPPAHTGKPPLDEHALTDHDARWRADLAMVASLGATVLRYGMSWPLVHTAPGTFDWSRLDEVVDEADALGIALVADLVHYGTPTWLPEAFADPGYPEAIEEFTVALLSRYGARIPGLTPLNEPLTTASFCGLRGVWPPYRHGWRGWVSIAVPMALGIVRSTRAARAAAHPPQVMHVEASTLVTATSSQLDEHAEHLGQIGWLPTDLALGRVDRSHPMHSWLLAHGAAHEDLDWLVQHAQQFDVIGVNYYPELTPRSVVDSREGPLQLAHDRWAEGLDLAVRGFATRYDLPVAITETSVEGDDQRRTSWLDAAVETSMRLRSDGVDLRGMVWWPMLDFVDWSWASGGANVEEFAVSRLGPDGTAVVAMAEPLGDPSRGKNPFLRRMGLIRLDEQSDGTLTRTTTLAAERFSQLATRDFVP